MSCKRAVAPNTLPLYSVSMEAHVISREKVQLVLSGGGDAAARGRGGQLAVDSDDHDEEDEEDEEEGVFLPGGAALDLGTCVAGFCAPGVMAAFTEEAPCDRRRPDVCSDGIALPDLLSDCNSS
jgi:hypothetical protein